MFLNLNTLGYDPMGRTMTLPVGNDYRHAVLDRVQIGDEVVTLDRDRLQLLSRATTEAYRTRRIRDGVEVDVRAVDMEPVHRCPPVSRDRARAVLWQHQPDALLDERHFRIDAWLIELNEQAADALRGLVRLP